MKGRDRVACLLIVLGVLAVGTGRQLAEGSRALADSDAARARGDSIEAVAAAKRAAEAVVPGSTHATEGYERLAEIAHDAERRGDETTAAAAWRAMRGASLATRALGVSSGAWRAMAEDGIVRVAGQAARASAAGAPATNAPVETVLRAALATDDTPANWRFLALAAGALGFLGVALRGFRSMTRIQIGRETPQNPEGNEK